MTSALDLLMDSDSTAETTTLLESNGICTIDSRTRTIFVPPEIVVGAVQSDKNAERIKFSCPKIVGDNLDLSKFSIRINFENVSSVDPDISIKDQYICEDASINEDNITFSWVVGKNAARYMGTIRFIVCAVKTDSDSNISIEWNTTVAQIPVLEGIEVDQPSLDENNKDIINQLLAITKTASDEAVKNVNSAKEQAITDIQNVSQPDKTLTVEGGIADAKATGNAISSLRTDIKNIHQSSSLVDFENIKWIENTYIDHNTGEEIPYENWVATDYIELSPQKLACIHLNNDGVFSVFAGHVYYAWYDSNKKYLTGGNVASVLKYFDVNAKYIRLSFMNAQIAHVVLNTEAVIDALMGKDVSYFVPYGKIRLDNELNIERTRKDVDYLYSKLPEDLSSLDVEKNLVKDEIFSHFSSGAVQYIMLTDSHIDAFSKDNQKAILVNYQKAVELANESSIDFICIGGDQVNGFGSLSNNNKAVREINDILSKSNKPVIILRGNHDNNKNAGQQIDEQLTIPQWYGRNQKIFRRNSFVYQENIEEGTGCYFYYDIPQKKTRIIALDSWWNSHPNEQLQFLVFNAMTELDGWNYILLSHLPPLEKYNTGGATETWENGITRINNFILAFNSHSTITDVMYGTKDYSKSTSKVICITFGHTHASYLGFDSDMDTFITSTGSGGMYGNKKFNGENILPDDNLTNRTDLQLTDPNKYLFDVFTVNKKSIYRDRFGNGDNKEIIISS